MERLTRRNDVDGSAFYPVCFEKCEGDPVADKCFECAMEKKICETLAAYEETGLTPEDIVAVQEAMSDMGFRRFREIMEAEGDGRLVIVPSETDNAETYVPDKDVGNMGRVVVNGCISRAGLMRCVEALGEIHMEELNPDYDVGFHAARNRIQRMIAEFPAAEIEFVAHEKDSDTVAAD